MTDKVDCAIWVWDNELQRKKRIRLQTLLNRVNHTLRHENQTYFALISPDNLLWLQSLVLRGCFSLTEKISGFNYLRRLKVSDNWWFSLCLNRFSKGF